ncbi:11826_t:CDS:2 [Ambispora gerdemannii]|uniref:Defect at low temperature protein 1 n=1 Tax=Ambispora gerdemannii TaxID=144530 RepID=A0A9N8YRH4_9GLOM|nr:11826_t:CDS:2 [Ambispora gerdemannii]
MERDRVGNGLYITSLFFLGLLTAAVLSASAADIIKQTEYKNPRRWLFLSPVIGGYFLMGITAATIGFCRLRFVKKAPVYNFISSELTRVSMIALEGEPRPEDNGQPGWGRPGSSLENIHFRTTISQTPSIIEQVAVESSSLWRRQPSLSVHRYIEFLIEYNVVDRQIGYLYIEGYERARFGEDEFTEQQFTEFYKIVTVLLEMIKR